ncbi:MAG: RluA family pseudouridine synthase [Pseudomonadales bacterium]
MSSVSRSVTVPPELAGERADRVAALLFDEFSRAVLTRWMREGALTVDDAPIKPKVRLLGGERMRLEARLVAREDWRTAQDVPFRVVYEDEHLLVVDKPAGIVVHPGAGNADGTLVNGLLRYRPSLAVLPRAGIVHRLDKDTSGLLLVAATLESQHRLARMLARREISRRYLAVVEGSMVSGMEIEQPLGRDPLHRTRQAVRPDGRPAHTSVRVLERFRRHTSVEAALHTGRTHQIRVHLAHAGYPLVGDRRYGARGRLPPHPDPHLVAVIQAFSRQALHAAELALQHPVSGELLRFQSAPPPDIEQLLVALRQDTAAAAALARADRAGSTGRTHD